MQRNNDPRPVKLADLYCGEGAATKAAILAGMEVVYAYEPTSYVRERYTEKTGLPVDGVLGPVGMTGAPEFEALMINLPAAACLSESVISQALRLVRERWPQVIVVEGPTPRTSGDSVTLGEICRSLEQAGYYVAWRPKIGDNFTNSPAKWRTVIIATWKKAVFVWPDEVDEGGGPQIRLAKGQPSPLLLAVMEAVDMVLRGPMIIEVWNTQSAVAPPGPSEEELSGAESGDEGPEAKE